MNGLLSDQEMLVVKACLRATVEGDFSLDWEFQTLFGIDRKIVLDIRTGKKLTGIKSDGSSDRYDMLVILGWPWLKIRVLFSVNILTNLLQIS
jgi:hypothetical protein